MVVVFAVVTNNKLTNIKESLSNEEGFNTNIFIDYRLFLDAIKITKPNIIILQHGILHIDVFQLLIYLKHHPLLKHIPVVIIGNNEIELDYHRCFELEPDDYWRESLENYEIKFRIRALLRRFSIRRERIDDLIIDYDERIVYIKEKRIKLTEKEFLLLDYLCQHYQKIVTRKDIERYVWKTKIGNSRTLDMHICSLRGKVFIDSTLQLETIIKVGYRLK